MATGAVAVLSDLPANVSLSLPGSDFLSIIGGAAVTPFISSPGITAAQSRTTEILAPYASRWLRQSLRS